MELYHVVASERGEDGTQIIDMGLFKTKKDAKARINQVLNEYKRDFPNSHISKKEMRAWEESVGNETYEWVADILVVTVI